MANSWRCSKDYPLYPNRAIWSISKSSLYFFRWIFLWWCHILVRFASTHHAAFDQAFVRAYASLDQVFWQLGSNGPSVFSGILHRLLFLLPKLPLQNFDVNRCVWLEAKYCHVLPQISYSLRSKKNATLTFRWVK